MRDDEVIAAVAGRVRADHSEEADPTRPELRIVPCSDDLSVR
jgi:hypothetical protein